MTIMSKHTSLCHESTVHIKFFAMVEYTGIQSNYPMRIKHSWRMTFECHDYLRKQCCIQYRGKLYVDYGFRQSTVSVGPW